jgi:hypothetical protein
MGLLFINSASAQLKHIACHAQVAPRPRSLSIPLAKKMDSKTVEAVLREFLFAAFFAI